MRWIQIVLFTIFAVGPLVLNSLTAASPGMTERVSVSSAGSEGNHHSDWPAISAEGRFVAFASHASNLVPGDTNGFSDVFVHDRLTGTTERVTVGRCWQRGELAHLRRLNQRRRPLRSV